MPMTPSNPFKWRHYPGAVIICSSPLVPPLPAGLRACGRTDAGAGTGRRRELRLAVPSRPTAQSWRSVAALTSSRRRRATVSMRPASGSGGSIATSSGRWTGRARQSTFCSPLGATPVLPGASSARHSSSPGNPDPRVINVDKNPAYPAAVEALKAEGTLRRRCRLLQCKFLNNIVEQDHRTVKQRVWLAKGYGSFRTAWRTLRGIEAVSMIRKGRARRVAKGDAVAQARFIGKLFGLAA